MLGKEEKGEEKGKNSVEIDNIKKEQLNVQGAEIRIENELGDAGKQQNELKEIKEDVQFIVDSDASLEGNCLNEMIDKITMKRKERQMKRFHLHAIKIQSFYRGYRVRKAYAEIKQPVVTGVSSPEYNGSDGDVDSVYDEVNLDEFDLDDATLQWDTNINYFSMLHQPPLPCLSRSHHEAWCSSECASRKSCEPSKNSPQIVCLIPASTVVSTEENSICSRSTSAACSSKSFPMKAEMINSDWGFQNENTGQLMLKRAKKFGVGKKKKTNSTDRYQLFKKTTCVTPQHENNQILNQFPTCHVSSSLFEQMQVSQKDATYSWVCNQPVLHADRADEVLSRNGKFYTEIESKICKETLSDECESIILPRIDPAILAGKQLSLIQSEIHNPKPTKCSTERRSSGLILKSKEKRPSGDKSHSAPVCTTSGRSPTSIKKNRK